jgi:hypothetical protein
VEKEQRISYAPPLQTSTSSSCGSRSFLSSRSVSNELAREDPGTGEHPERGDPNPRLAEPSEGGMAAGRGDCALLTAAASKKGQAVDVELCGRTVAVFVDDDLGEIRTC